jgi:hypothetical protein
MQKSLTNLFIAKKDLPAILVIAMKLARSFSHCESNLPAILVIAKRAARFLSLRDV